MARERKAKTKPSKINVNPTVSIIGGGRLGTALGVAFSAKGYTIEAVVSRRIDGARRAACAIGTQTKALSLSQLSDLPSSKVLFITTPDDAIETVAAELAGAVKSRARGRIALHASGALSSESLSSLRAVGFHIGSMHPLVSVSDPRPGAVALTLAHYCIEGGPQAVRVARSMVRVFGGKSFSIHTRDRALYHAAAVMSSGHMVALFDIVTKMLLGCGLTEKQARDALLPLLKSTVENLGQHSTARALTGTFARADAATMLKHLAALSANGDSVALEAYKLLGLRSLELARENGAATASLRVIKHILEGIHGEV